MALYRARKNNEIYQVAACCPDVLRMMVEFGHAVISGPYVRMTDEGIHAWADMSQLSATATPIRLPEAKTPPPVKMYYLTPSQERTLTALEMGPQCVTVIHPNSLPTLIEREWVRRSGDVVAITEQGRAVMARWRKRGKVIRQNTQVMDESLIDAIIDQYEDRKRRA